MDVRVRPVIESDRGALEAAVASDKTFRTDEIAVAMELVDSAIASAEDYRILVAEVPKGPGEERWVAGYVCYGKTPMTQATYDLYWVVSHAKARGKGIARCLIQAMEAALRDLGATAIRVETSSQDSYEAARRLYQRLEYPTAARFADFYHKGDDLIVYYKCL